jgi:hypothetical protein
LNCDDSSSLEAYMQADTFDVIELIWLSPMVEVPNEWQSNKKIARKIPA